MRRIVTSGLLAALAFTAAAPVSAQRTDSPAAKMFERESDFAFIRPITDGGGVLIRWQMKSESGVAVFNLYRVDGEAKLKVNRSLIPSTAPAAVSPGAFPDEHQHFDLDGREGAEYVVEAVRFDGGRLFSNPVAAKAVKSVEAEVGISTETLRQAAMQAEQPFESRGAEVPSELAALAATYTQAPNLASQFDVASKPGAKIAVRQDGFYRVTASELQTASFPVTSDPAKWRLFQNGVEQAIIVGPNGAYIEFYGRGLDLAETNSRIYYLLADTVAGKRIQSRVVRVTPGSPTARNFPAVFEKKERTVYHETLGNYDEENFIGQAFDSTGLLNPIRFNLTAIDFSAPTASIKITLYGVGNSTQHRVTPTLNGNELPVMTQFGAVNYSQTFSIPTEYLVEGENVLDLRSGQFDFNHFNKLEVSYKRLYKADSGRLAFSSPGYRKIDFHGFDTSAVRVFDTTFEENPVLLSAAVEETGSGFRVRLPASRTMTGYVVEDTALLQSPSVTANVPSTWSRTTNAADMLIISHSDPSFLSAAENWATYRRSAAGGSLNTKVVNIEDIYDEFNYGTRGAEAIKNFLKYASENWPTAPKYVLLVGDASKNPRQYALTSEPASLPDLVPSKIVRLIQNETVSDEALGDFDDDDVSAIAIGRIPARTAADITSAFNKMVAFEATQASFARGSTFVHDANAGIQSAANTQAIIQRLPQGAPFDVVSGAEPNAQGNIVARFNQGKFLVNYFGHGSSGVWAGVNLFGFDAVNLLTNRDNPSFVPMFSCLNGDFGLPSRVSLAEYLLSREQGGAAAVWASTGSTTPDEQRAMAEKFFDALVGTTHTRVGDMIRVAKAATPSGRDVKLSWALMGDPAMKMP